MTFLGASCFILALLEPWPELPHARRAYDDLHDRERRVGHKPKAGLALCAGSSVAQI